MFITANNNNNYNNNINNEIAPLLFVCLYTCLFNHRPKYLPYFREVAQDQDEARSRKKPRILKIEEFGGNDLFRVFANERMRSTTQHSSMISEVLHSNAIEHH